MRENTRGSTKHKGASLAKGPAWFLGLAALALGVLGMLFAGTDFASSPMDGDVNGSNFLGIEGNGWTWALFGAGGLLLLLAAPMHWGAKTMALVVGLAFGAASVISMVDGSDVFGIIATNGLTQLVLGAGAVALLITALLPRAGRKHKDTDTAPAPRRERVVERETVETGRVHHPEGHVVETDRADRVERTGRFDRPAADDRETVTAGRDERRVEQDHHGIEPGRGRVVAPADGDGVEDHGRRRDAR